MVRSRHQRDRSVSFDDSIREHSQPVIELCFFALNSHENENFPCRDFLNHLYRAAARLEELVDYLGAQRNTRWFPFREAVAAAKLFADVTYQAKHIQGSLPYYKLKNIESDFVNETNRTLLSLKGAIINIAENLLAQAKRCGLLVGNIEPKFTPCTKEKVTKLLPSNRSVRHVAKVGEVVVSLATRFLNLSEDRDVRLVLKQRRGADYSALVPEPISEEQVRIVEARFHNLQSLYDTYVFESDLEQQNPDLRFMRGHISVIFHLTDMATALSHYYIRHMSALRRHVRVKASFPMRREELLRLLFEYQLRYSRLFLESAVDLCRHMISAYSEYAEIEVPIPCYRGFHVRPSTLVARIVNHYGSKVTMTLNNHDYNAGTPFELFRANEDINAIKRRRIADILCDDPELNRPVPDDPEERSRQMQLLFVRLMKDDLVVIYDTGLYPEDIGQYEASTMAELATQLIKHFVSLGKMDIRSELTVRFSGDNRALHDLEILANNGYGEDQIGNNIVLPPELSYLNR